MHFFYTFGIITIPVEAENESAAAHKAEAHAKEIGKAYFWLGPSRYKMDKFYQPFDGHFRHNTDFDYKDEEDVTWDANVKYTPVL